jgi:hypothetical protein
MVVVLQPFADRGTPTPASKSASPMDMQIPCRAPHSAPTADASSQRLRTERRGCGKFLRTPRAQGSQAGLRGRHSMGGSSGRLPRPRQWHVPDILSIAAEDMLATAHHQLAHRNERAAQGSFCQRQWIRDKGQQHLPGDEAWLIGEHRMRTPAARHAFLRDFAAEIFPHTSVNSRGSGKNFAERRRI